MKKILLLFLSVSAVVLSACEKDIATTYPVTVTNDGNGMAVAVIGGENVAEAAEGVTVTLMATADESYVFDKWTAGSGNVTFAKSDASTTSFIMPAGEVNIKAEFKLKDDIVETYPITFAYSDYGTAIATVDGREASEAETGKTVTITARPANGYVLKEWTTVSAGVSFKNANTSPTTFTMPAGEVEIEMEFARVYSITINNPVAGGKTTVTVDGKAATNAMAGKTVTITAAPASGYEFSKWTTESAGVALADADAATTTFTMPANDVEIDVEYTDDIADILPEITDAAFRAYCEYAMQNEYAYMDLTGAVTHPAWDTNGNGLLSSGEAAAVRGILLSMGPATVSSLPGLEYFTALEYLDCKNQGFASLDLSNNKTLVTVFLNDNPTTSLDMSGCTALRVLYCNGNQLDELDLSGCPSLLYLECFRNQLESLDLSECTSLVNLNCADNKLRSLDLSNNRELGDHPELNLYGSLQCSGNQLTSLDVSDCTALNFLLCERNQLTSLDISKNTALELLMCSANPGNGTTFPVTAWFDNDSAPSWSPRGDIGGGIIIDYVKAE
jgi:hypothetical protein